jgi:tRNA(Arg) A34 adenosine deaminase TadA
MKYPTSVTLTLPAWLDKMLGGKEKLFPDPEERMRWVIGLSRRNVEEKTGGPFAAAVFACGSGRLLGAGVNRVEPLRLSPAHAEVVAFAFAQRRAKSYDLSCAGDTELVASSQPCLMCLGATLWSGVTRLTFAASAADVQGVLGFDEGPLPRNWQEELARRGITVVGEFLRAEAVEALELYRRMAGTVYNSRRGS